MSSRSRGTVSSAALSIRATDCSGVLLLMMDERPDFRNIDREEQISDPESDDSQANLESFKLLKHNYETIDIHEKHFIDPKPVSNPKGPLAQMAHDIEDDLKEMDRLTQQAIDRIIQDAVEAPKPASK